MHCADAFTSPVSQEGRGTTVAEKRRAADDAHTARQAVTAARVSGDSDGEARALADLQRAEVKQKEMGKQGVQMHEAVEELLGAKKKVALAQAKGDNCSKRVRDSKRLTQ